MLKFKSSTTNNLNKFKNVANNTRNDQQTLPNKRRQQQPKQQQQPRQIKQSNSTAAVASSAQFAIGNSCAHSSTHQMTNENFSHNDTSNDQHDKFACKPSGADRLRTKRQTNATTTPSAHSTSSTTTTTTKQTTKQTTKRTTTTTTNRKRTHSSSASVQCKQLSSSAKLLLLSGQQQQQQQQQYQKEHDTRLQANSAAGQLPHSASSMTLPVVSATGKQQLAGRVKSIKVKLLESHGAELRRTLFSLRQIFQDDSELANGFVEANGFECLLKVARDADQIQQNYILRAIGQLVAYPAGMNCLARHNEAIQWLYTLLTAQHRLVVRTALKLLLLFVSQQNNNNNNNNNNSTNNYNYNVSQFCAAIKQVDNSRGSRYWSHLIELFKPDTTTTSNATANDSNNSNNFNSNLNLKEHQTQFNQQQQQQQHQIQDVSLLIDSMTLVNKTLDNIPQDQEDTYFDFIDALEQSGMESIIKKYSNLDAQLKEQFRIYEQKLASEEDENEDEEEMEQQQQQVDNRTSDCKQRERVKFSPNTIEAAIRKENSVAQEERELKSNQFTTKQRELLSSTSSSSSTLTRNNDNSNTPLKQRQQQQAVQVAASSNNISESFKVPLATSSEFNILDSGEQTPNDDNEYESANDESNEQVTVAADLVFSNANADDDGDESARDLSNGCNQIIVNNKLVQTVNEDHQQQHNTNNRRHQLQLRSQPAPQYQRISNVMKQQNNLARGKQQRASISSCSSSDSYASYGSGYASGSGNSTDHEHKQQRQNSQPSSDAANSSSNNNGNAVASTDLTTLTTGIINLNINSNKQQKRRRSSTREQGESPFGNDAVGDDDVDNEVNEEDVRVAGDDEDDNDSQLKQHLSELEQLTDELSKRDIYSPANQPAQSTSKHYSSTIKSSSSNTSSVISTSSNISSLSSGLNSTTSAKQQQQATANAYQFRQSSTPAPPPLPRNNIDASTNDSRSTSTTPTSLLQQTESTTVSNVTTASPQVSPYHARKQQAQLDSSNDTAHTNLVRTANQYAMPSITSNGSPARSQQRTAPTTTTISSSTPTKQLPQESYYHNLFQWEQLVSKGVTRPLLINDLDFTDLRDEDDCDLLNSSAANQATPPRLGRNQSTGEPLTISIPSTHQVGSNTDHDSVDSGASTGSPGSRSASEHLGTPATAPPPLPPPPISPWFNTISGSRPQSQFMSSPSPPPFDFNTSNGSLQQQLPKDFNRDQSPAASTYSTYSRNSVCVSQQPPTSQQFNTLQPVGLRSASSMSSLLFGNNGKYANKRKKTMKLFWKEVREDRSLLARLTKKKTIWDEIKPVQVDTSKLEYLFESKAKDLSLSKSRNGLDGSNQRKVKITVLDAKRSNAINIGMTKLPPMRTIKSAILKMDSSIMNREGIEKILTTMMPTEEEKSRIIEAQLANPDTPLGTAEQFLLNLASISALEARLKLWAFQLDYAQIEKEVAEPLMDLKQAIDEIERSETFRNILGTLLSIGNFLNSTNAKGFQIDYLEKVPEVKDTVHKHSLLHHLCLFIQEKFDPELSSDLYSEFSAVNRASKVDYTEVAKSLKKMQQDCKASWDYLKIVAKHDGLANLMNTCGVSSPSSSEGSPNQHQQKPAGKLNNLSKLSMITTVIGSESTASSSDLQQSPATKQLRMKVSDFLTDCAERIMVLMVIHRRVMNRFQKLLVYLGCPLHQIKQTQPQQILKIINEFALEYRTKRERVREMLMKKQQCQHHHHHANRWQMNRMRWAGSQQYIDSLGYNNRPSSTASSCASSTYATNSLSTNCPDCALNSRHHHTNGNHASNRPNSPSGLSQISNYSDFLLDQSCCSRQESITPMPQINGVGRRPHSMSVSMLDLQQQQQQQQQQQSKSANNSFASNENYTPHNSSLDENELARQKDEQLRRLLGAGKSLDEACHDLYQMSHWSSTMARINRHPPTAHKQRAASLAPWSQRNVEM